jgi:predicted nucleic acid-binding protein
VIVVDTSAWLELLRGTESAVDLKLRSLIERRAHLAVTEVVIAEVLAGVPPRAVQPMRDRLVAFRVLHLRGLADFEAAADLYRVCRDAGESVRQLTDCLVAVPVIEAGARLLHADRDFDKLARHTPLQIEPLAA